MNICEKRVQDDVSRLKKSTSQAIECFCEQMSAITFQFFTSSNFGSWRSTEYIFFLEPFVRVWTLVEINSGARSCILKRALHDLFVHLNEQEV